MKQNKTRLDSCYSNTEQTKQLLNRFLGETAVKLLLVRMSPGNNCSDCFC